MNTRFKLAPSKIALLSAALTLLVLSACQPKAVRPPASLPAPAVKMDTTGAIRYQIDSAATEVHILVYRSGAMARLGHNHVVSSKNASGTLLLHSDLARSRLELTVPVATLVVDDPQARASEGEDFAADVPPDAREGTRRNLLRADVLDSERYPTITLQSVAVAGSRANPSIIMHVTIKGVTRDVVVLALVKEESNRIVAEGEFAIQQSDFGITPFSVGLGALQVQDKLRIRFKIVAAKQG